MNKTVALFVVVLAVIGMYLQSQGKLRPTFTALITPVESANTISLAEFVIAFLVYLFILSFLKPSDGAGLTIIVVMGALLVNEQNAKKHGQTPLLELLFSKP